MDMDAARAWIEDHEGAGNAKASVLHPADPRHRERTAAAAMRRIEADLRRGVLVRTADVIQKVSDEEGAVRSMLLGIPALFALPVPGETVERALTDAIEGTLEELRADSPAEWPRPKPGPADEDGDN